MEITTQFTKEVAAELTEALEQKGASQRAKKILDELQSLNVTIRKMHPGIEDDALGRYFVVSAPRASAESVLAKVQGLPGVTSAYIKPSAKPA